MAELLQQIVEHGFPIGAGILGFFRPLDACKLIAGALVGAGTCGYVYPVGMGRVFGIPFADKTNTLFFPGIGGRNLAAGLTTLILSFLSKRNEAYGKALGVLLGCWTLAGFSDTGILMATPGGEKHLEHLRNVAVLAVVSWKLLTRDVKPVEDESRDHLG